MHEPLWAGLNKHLKKMDFMLYYVLIGELRPNWSNS